MIEKIKIKQIDNVYNQIICDDGIARELSDRFTFEVDGHKYMPSFRNRRWDGKIRIFDYKNRKLYVGLNSRVEEYAKEKNYKLEYLSDFSDTELSLIEAKEFAKAALVEIEAREYQIKTFAKCVRRNRALVLSPTASGKSLIIYLLGLYYRGPVLIVVPTVSLVHQMSGDFKNYGYQGTICQIYAGQEKDTNQKFTITTWQSIYKMPKTWFEKFSVVIVDEAHLAQAKSLVGIMKKTPTVKYKFGFTGTLDGSLCNEMILEGLFGRTIKLVTTSELIEQKYLSDLKIKCIVLKYDDKYRKEVAKLDYANEIDWLLGNQARNNFIKNLTLSLDGNTMLLFRYIEKHGKPLYDLIRREANAPVYYVSGEIDGEAREQIRKIVETHARSIIVASVGVFSTGINIVHLHNIILASPVKSRVRTLQSIGRGLRISDKKELCTLYDIIDDLSYRNRKNFTLKHGQERIKLYNIETFNYKIYNVLLTKSV